jgi:hypothetical protein
MTHADDTDPHRSRSKKPYYDPTLNYRTHMKHPVIYPKVIIHRLGNYPQPERRPLRSLVPFLVLGLIGAGVFAINVLNDKDEPEEPANSGLRHLSVVVRNAP